MKPWETLGQVTVPGTTKQLQLSRRDTEYSLTIDNYELINNRMHHSQDVAAEMACDAIEKCHVPAVLIGGLGMGFTLSAALKKLNPEATVTVAELVPEVIKWNYQYFSEFNDNPLADPRVTVQEGDIRQFLVGEERAYNAIMLDVDNGPQALTKDNNSWLYSNEGLTAVFRILRSSGAFVVWSRFHQGTFTRRLHHIGFEVSEHTERARGPKGGPKHTIYLAIKPRRSKK